MAEPTYIFRDGNVYTMEDEKIVASVKEADFEDPQGQGGHPVPGEVEMPEPPVDASQHCPGCGREAGIGDKFCPNCGTPLSEGSGESGLDVLEPYPPGSQSTDGVLEPHAPGFASSTKQSVTTPNGLKGRVLARVPALWGEEVTVRFENGVIKRIPVDANLTFASVKEETPETPVKGLEERLAATTLTDKDSLVERAKELRKIKAEARKLVSDSPDSEAAILDRLCVEADYELREVTAALAHYSDIEGKGFEPPAPIDEIASVEQASIGSSKADWLESAHQEMVTEASAEDFEKLMDEGPEAFVAGLNLDQLADAGTARVMAAREIRSHTAGAHEDTRVDYERVWLARVEEKRREVLASRKEEVRKEASSQEETPPPDESLFI